MFYTFITYIAQITSTPGAGGNAELGNPSGLTPESTKADIDSHIGFMQNFIPGKDITDIIANVINYAFDLVGIISVAMLVYGGILYLTSAGDEQKAKQGQSVITYAVIGIIITLGALVILRAVRSAIGL